MRIEYVSSEDGMRVPLRAFSGGGSHSAALMFHGLQSHSAWFINSGRFLSARGIAVYAFDRRGSGLSAEPRGICRSYSDILTDAAAAGRFALRDSGCEAIHVIGHCFGALPALVFALDNPDLVRSVILTSPGIAVRVRPSLGELGRASLNRLLGREARVPIPFTVEQLTDFRLARNRFRNDSRALHWTDLQTYLEILKMRFRLRSGAFSITMPVLCMLGGRDAITDNRRVRRICRRFGSSQVRILEYEEACHLLEYSAAAERYRRDIVGWIGAVDAAARQDIYRQSEGVG